jgi:hypothetical protein
LVSNELSGLTFSCPNNEGAVSLPFDSSVNLPALVASSSNIYCTGANTTLPCYACPIVSGDAMLQVFDMPVETNERSLFLACTVILLICYRTLAFLVLKYKNHIQK